MLIAGQSDGPPSKNIITLTKLQNYINKGQPPSKKEPFRTISEAPLAHALHIVTSGNYPQDVLEQTLQQTGTLHYARLHMKLIEIVSGDFFSDYIKTGNIIMISEGRQGHDETYSLREGVLRLEVLKSTYERLGLDGKPVMGHGRKHTKARYLIELNLRAPTMLRGKKGFERVLWAFKNVLVDTKTWLFCNVKAPADLTGPVQTFAPIVRAVKPVFEHESGVSVPDFDLGRISDEEDATDLQEWLSLVTLKSPRVRTDDNINSYLCRYSIPELIVQAARTIEAEQDEEMAENEPGNAEEELGDADVAAEESDDVAMADTQADEDATGIKQAVWRGLSHPDFVKPLYMLLLKNAPRTSWVAVTAHSFSGDSYTIITRGKEVIVYRFKD